MDGIFENTDQVLLQRTFQQYAQPILKDPVIPCEIL